MFFCKVHHTKGWMVPSHIVNTPIMAKTKPREYDIEYLFQIHRSIAKVLMVVYC